MSRMTSHTPPSRTPLLPRVLTFSEFQEEENMRVERPGHLAGDVAGMVATLAQQTAAEEHHRATQAAGQRRRRADQRLRMIGHVTHALFLAMLDSLHSCLEVLTGVTWA